MEMTYTHKHKKIDSAESARFSWSSLSDDYLFDKIEGRHIYQMSYVRSDRPGVDALDADVAAQVKDFWQSFNAEQDRIAVIDDAADLADVKSQLANMMPEAERVQKEKNFDNLYNEGFEGYNPYRG